MQSSPYDQWHEIVHQLIINLVLRPYYNYNYKFKVFGQENIPKKGPCIIASNHFSYNDPTIISLSLGKQVAYIAKQELFEGKLGEIITFLGAIPINRDKPGLSTIKQFKEAVAAGWFVGIFIEGTRNSSRTEMTKVHEGAAFFARLGGELPVLPLGIRGGHEKKTPLEIHVGKVIPYQKEISARELSLLYAERVAELAGLEFKIS